MKNLVSRVVAWFFPTYECRRCLDTLETYDQGRRSACGCPAAVADRDRKSREFWERMERRWTERKAKRDL